MLIDSADPDRVKKVLSDGVTTEFWEMLKEAIDDKLKMLERNFLADLENLRDHSAEDCKIEVKFYLAKKAYLEGMKELPLMIVHSFGKPNQEEPDLDPYETADSFLPKKKKK